MPIYEYRCTNGHVFELFQSMSDDPADACEECGAVAQRLLSAPAVHFKGSGFYTTDYAKKKGPAGGSADSGGGEKSSDSKSSSDGSSTGSGSGSGSGSGGDSAGSGSSSGSSSSSSSGSGSSGSGSSAA